MDSMVERKAREMVEERNGSRPRNPEIGRSMRIVAVASVLLLLLSPALTPVMAQNINEKLKPLIDKMDLVIRAAQLVLVTISALVFMYAGYMHMTAEGQPEKEQKARKALIGALIGLAIILMAEVIRTVIVNLLT